MTAADSLEQAAQRAAAMKYSGLALRIGVALALAVTLYVKGRSDGATAQRLATVDSVRHVFADTSRVAEQRVAARAPIVAQTKAAADGAKRVYREARTHVAIVADTVLRVDSVLVSVPMPAVEVIRAADATIANDSISYRAVAAQLEDMTLDRDTWRSRALLDEANTPKQPRFGFKAGVITGVTAVVTLAVTIAHYAR